MTTSIGPNEQLDHHITTET